MLLALGSELHENFDGNISDVVAIKVRMENTRSEGLYSGSCAYRWHSWPGYGQEGREGPRSGPTFSSFAFALGTAEGTR